MKTLSIRTRRKKAKILSSKIVYEGAVFGVRRDEVIEPSGVRTPAKWSLIRAPWWSFRSSPTAASFSSNNTATPLGNICGN